MKTPTRFQYNLSLLNGGSTTIRVEQKVNGVYQYLATQQTQTSSGTYELSFVPTETDIRISVSGTSRYALNNLYLDRDQIDTLVTTYALSPSSYGEHHLLTTSIFPLYRLSSVVFSSWQSFFFTSSACSGYRYGSDSYRNQGQEKDDEVSGKGNSYTAEFWQYDSRLGRRWNRDPKPNPSISNYACFANNPILYSDPYGDTIRIDDKATPEFKAQVERELEVLKTSKRGLELYNKLQNAEEDFVIKESTNGKSFFRPNKITVTNNQTKKVTEEYAKGGTIYYNTKGALLPVQMEPKSNLSKFEYSGMFSLFHELAHAEDYSNDEIRRDFDIFDNDKRGYRGLARSEWSATFTENEIRNDLKAPLRTYYNVIETPHERSGGPPQLIKSDSRGVKSLWNEKIDFYFIKY